MVWKSHSPSIPSSQASQARFEDVDRLLADSFARVQSSEGDSSTSHVYELDNFQLPYHGQNTRSRRDGGW